MGIDLRKMLTMPVRLRAASSESETASRANEPWYGRRRDRVITRLCECGGYGWEDELATELGWSSSMMRQTLAEMEAAGRIIRYEVGQRMVICTADQPHADGRVQGMIPGS